MSDPNEQDFLLEQLEALTPSESKELNRKLMHNVIHLRLSGQETDLKLQDKMNMEVRFEKTIKKISHELCVVQNSNDELKKQNEQLTESRDKYKLYWMSKEKENRNRKQERFSAGNGYSSRKTRATVEDGIETVEMETKAEVKRHKNGRKIVVEK